eukprot:m.190101 g.190101  ORF g.190101 m.190101 type:complete len:565 (+) comp17952_c0_seq1:112-1806(+)
MSLCQSLWLAGCLTVLCVVTTDTTVHGLTATEWKRRSIYQVITDRFALANGTADTCSQGGCPYGNYCGGSFKGLEQQLPYITGMGFDAIWISPVVDNIECGYHGYWAQKQFEIEAHFGGATQLSDLVNAARAAGVAVMLDIVVNHMGPPTQGNSFPEFSPFNSTDHYHGTLSSHCSATDSGISQNQREVCWLVNLGDLKQENPFVTKQLLAWMAGLQSTYGFDGIRIDTVPYVPKTFFKALKEGPLNNTYAVGECLVPISMQAVAGYQWSDDEGVQGPLLDGVLNYPLFQALRSAFQQGGSLNDLHNAWLEINATFHDAGALGTFAENHDQPRWLLSNSDVSTYQNALVFVFMAPGVPIAYYGTEQGMAGGESDNDKRQPLWQHGGYNTSSPLYQWTAQLVKARKAMLASLTDGWLDVVSQHSVTADGSVLSFVRGNSLVVMCKEGYAGTVSLPTTFSPNTKLCNALPTHPTLLHATRDTGVAGLSCNATSPRRDCGRVGTQKSDCEAAGCCWFPVNPNPSNDPWCFFPNAGPPPPLCVSVAPDGTATVQIASGLPAVFVVADD